MSWLGALPLAARFQVKKVLLETNTPRTVAFNVYEAAKWKQARANENFSQAGAIVVGDGFTVEVFVKTKVRESTQAMPWTPEWASE